MPRGHGRPPDTGSEAAAPRLLFSLILKRHGQPASVPWATHDEQRVSAYHEVHARHPESALRPRRARQRERQLREIHRGRESRTGPRGRREAPWATQTRGREQTAPGSQRARARPHAQRQHGLHGSAHPHPHGAGGEEVVENRDPAIGVQLHFAPGQRAAARGGLQGRTAVSEVSQHLTEQHQPQKSSGATHLHLLPWQPEEDGES